MDLTSFDGAIVALFVLLPGVIASRTFRQSADLRDILNTEGRIGSVLAWAAIVGTVNAMFLPALRDAFDALYNGRWEISIGVLPLLLLGVPYAVGLALGSLARGDEVREFLKKQGFLSTRERTVWDNISANQDPLWIEFRDRDVRYRGSLRRSDPDLKQLFLIRIQRHVEGESWERFGENDVLLRDGCEPMWFFRPNKPEDEKWPAIEPPSEQS